MAVPKPTQKGLRMIYRLQREEKRTGGIADLPVSGRSFQTAKSLERRGLAFVVNHSRDQWAFRTVTLTDEGRAYELGAAWLRVP